MLVALGSQRRKARTPTTVRQPAPQSYDGLVAGFGTAVTSYWKFQNTGTDEKAVQNATINDGPELNVETIVDLDRIAAGLPSDGTCIAFTGASGDYAEAGNNAAHKTAEGTIVVHFQCDTLNEKSILVCADANLAAGGLSMEINTNGSPRAYLRNVAGVATVLTGTAGDVQLLNAYSLMFKWGAEGISLALYDDSAILIRRVTNPLSDPVSGASPIRFGAWHTDTGHHDGPYGRVAWFNRRLTDSEEVVLARSRTITHDPGGGGPPSGAFLCAARTSPAITNTYKNLGLKTYGGIPPNNVASGIVPSVGGTARYDMTGTIVDHIYYSPGGVALDNDVYSPRFAIDITTAHNGGCLFGATIINGYDDHFGPPPTARRYPSTHGGQIAFRNATVTNFLIDGCRIHHAWDPVRFGPGSSGCSNITVQSCWFSEVFDDMIENDNHASAVFIEDTLGDKLFTAFSDRNSGTTNYGSRITTFRNCLLRLEQMYVVNDPGTVSTGNYTFQFFKMNGNGVSIDLFDNLFYVPKVVSTNSSTGGDPFYDLKTYNKLRNSSGNRLIWGGGGSYPYSMPSGFTLSTNASTWTTERANWLNAHSHVPRIPGIDT